MFSHRPRLCASAGISETSSRPARPPRTQTQVTPSSCENCENTQAKHVESGCWGSAPRCSTFATLVSGTPAGGATHSTVRHLARQPRRLNLSLMSEDRWQVCAIDPMSHKIWLTMRRVIFRLGNCTVEWDDNNMHVIACLGVAVLRMHAVEVTRAFFKLEKYRNGCDTGLRARGAQEAGGAPPPAAAGVARKNNPRRGRPFSR